MSRIDQILKEHYIVINTTSESAMNPDLKLKSCMEVLSSRIGKIEAENLQPVFKWMISSREESVAKYICFMASCALRVTVSNIQTIQANLGTAFNSRFSSFYQGVVYPTGGIRHVASPSLEQLKI